MPSSDLRERSQKEGTEYMTQFTQNLKNNTLTGKTKICVFRDAAFIAIIGNQRNFLLNGNKTIQIITLRAKFFLHIRNWVVVRNTDARTAGC